MRVVTAGSAGLLAGALILAAPALAGTWKYEKDQRDQPELSYREDGKAIFFMGCGRAFGLHVKYPGTPKTEGEPARITIASASTAMSFSGEFESPSDDMATSFLQWDLGFRRQDPALYDRKWKAVRNRLLDLLGSGAPLTISAGKHRYQLPPNDAAGWRQAFEACG